ncbi:hypothetical protein SAMD00079811_59480 [Scytonema sp. HK-05]|nr:hypothetical protein NIES2130_32800 [Scytonema sp. HK-05]BAY48327.1 hypothetical protein SAMD00079811_59480 [Scytonema sp. HK-05]
MTLPRFEEPHPPTPLSASREGGVFHTCQLKFKHAIYRRFRSPNRVKKGAKILFPPFPRGDSGGIKNLDGTLKNDPMLVNNDFWLKLILMGVFPPLPICSPPHKLCAICSERFSAKAPTTNYAYPSFLGWQTTSTEKGAFLPLLACGEQRRAGVPPVEATAEEGLGVGFSAAGIYKENLQ